MVRLALLCFALASVVGCKTRLIDEELFLAPPPPDFAVPPDLTVPPDFAPPPDLVAPFFCRPIYVVDRYSQKIAAFAPAQNGVGPFFQDVGVLQCSDGTFKPDTMSIDLSGFAWVFYEDGSLFKVDLSDPLLPCSLTAFDPSNINDPQNPMNWRTFGSSFCRDQPNSAQETLFVSLGARPFGTPPLPPLLGGIDPDTFAFTPGPPIADQVELTGTADAELWMFNPAVRGSHIARLDRVTGAEDRRIDIPQINVIGNFAFAFWGGSFWIFNGDGPHMKNGDRDTNVYRVDPDGTTAKVLSGTQKWIVGAGVSGCAPLGLDR